MTTRYIKGDIKIADNTNVSESAKGITVFKDMFVEISRNNHLSTGGAAKANIKKRSPTKAHNRAKTGGSLISSMKNSFDNYDLMQIHLSDGNNSYVMTYKITVPATIQKSKILLDANGNIDRTQFDSSDSNWSNISAKKTGIASASPLSKRGSSDSSSSPISKFKSFFGQKAKAPVAPDPNNNLNNGSSISSKNSSNSWNLDEDEDDNTNGNSISSSSNNAIENADENADENAELARSNALKEKMNKKVKNAENAERAKFNAEYNNMDGGKKLKQKQVKKKSINKTKKSLKTAKKPIKSKAKSPSKKKSAINKK